METLHPSPCIRKPDFLMPQVSRTGWTREENKVFEKALAIYDENTPDRWARVASMIPGKSVRDVVRQYMELEADVSDIEAGLVPVPGYLSNFTPSAALGDGNGFDEFRKKYSTRVPYDHERKKGVPWTEDEHRRFLMGLEKYGKGDWRNISRNFVKSKTPTQVASHAQKYFIRQNSDAKDKRRPSIHDITTVHLGEFTGRPINGEKLPLDIFMPVQEEQDSPPKVFVNLNRYNSGGVAIFGSNHHNPFHGGSINQIFQTQPTRQQIYG